MRNEVKRLQNELEICIDEIRKAEEVLERGWYANRQALQNDIDKLYDLKESIIRKIGVVRRNTGRRWAA